MTLPPPPLMQLSDNGIVSFSGTAGVLSNRVQSFPRVVYPLIPTVVPLWTTFIPQTQGILFRRITEESFQLSWVKSAITHQNPDLQDYEPSVAVIITWHDFVLPNGETVSGSYIIYVLWLFLVRFYGG